VAFFASHFFPCRCERRPPPLEPRFDFFFHAVAGRFVKATAFRKICLGHEISLEVMRVLIAAGVAGDVAVLQVTGHGESATALHVLGGGLEGGIGAVALRRGGQVDGGMSEDGGLLGSNLNI
jgi:hypothetical protein